MKWLKQFFKTNILPKLGIHSCTKMVLFRSVYALNNSPSTLTSWQCYLTWYLQFCMGMHWRNSECQNHDSLCSHSVKIEFTCRNNMGLISVLYVSCACMHFYFKLHDLREWHPVCECVWICGYRCALKTKVFNLAATFLILALVFLVIFPRAPYCSYAHGFSILLK